MGLVRPHERGESSSPVRPAGFPAQRRHGLFARRRGLVLLVVGLVVAILALACAETTKYRVLSFFFDGVPQPGTSVSQRKAPRKGIIGPQPERAAKRTVAPPKTVYRHAPYREFRCGACHNPDGNQLFRTPEEGLCTGCHTTLVADLKYLHGPAAVNACLRCHHPHRSFFPKLLLKDAKVICFDCHKREDIASGPHHAAVAEQRCIDCHDPHGGEDRFFLKRTER